MLNYDENKVYMLHILLPERDPVTNVIVPGKHLKNTICEYEGLYPDFKKIVVYEADTKEAIGIIKSNQ